MVVELSNKFLIIISVLVIIIGVYFYYNNNLKSETFRRNIDSINVNSVRPSFSTKKEKTVDQTIWDSNELQMETWPSELSVSDLKIEPFHTKKSVGFK